MSTLNGQDLNITSIGIISAQNNIYTTLPGTASNSIYAMGYEGLNITITGWEVTEGAYQLVRDQLMKTGEQSLIIIDGWEYRIYVMSVNRNIDTRVGFYPWSATCKTIDPYQYSTDETTRSKTITTDGQTWSADDSTYPILNSQVANTTADVQAIGVANDTYTAHIRYEDKIDSTVYTPSHSAGWVLQTTHMFPAKAYHSLVLTDVSAAIQGDEGLTSGLVKVTYQLGSGTETDYCELSNGSSSYVTDTYAAEIAAALNTAITVRFYGFASATGTFAYVKDSYARVSFRRRQTTNSPEVYNTAYTAFKCSPCNRLPHNAVARVNTDSTGTWSYAVGFDSYNSLYDCYDHQNVSYSSSHCVFDNSSYLYFDIDCKYPIVGIPTIAANYSGIGGGCYIDDHQIPNWINGGAAALDNPTYHLAGKTKFQLQFKCTTSVNFKIQDFKIEIDTNAGSAVFPVIVGGSVTNTMKCDQDSDGSGDAVIGLSYNERRWG